MPKTLFAQRDVLVKDMATLDMRMNTSAERTFVSAPSATASNPERDALERKVRLQIADKKKLAKQRPAFFLQWLYPACEMRLTDVADELIGELVKKAGVAPADVRFNALTAAAGAASDGQLVALADYLGEPPEPWRGSTLPPGASARAPGTSGRSQARARPGAALRYERDPLLREWAEQRLRTLNAAAPRHSCEASWTRAQCNQQRIEAVLSGLEAQAGIDLPGSHRGTHASRSRVRARLSLARSRLGPIEAR